MTISLYIKYYSYLVAVNKDLKERIRIKKGDKIELKKRLTENEIKIKKLLKTEVFEYVKDEEINF